MGLTEMSMTDVATIGSFILAIPQAAGAIASMQGPSPTKAAKPAGKAALVIALSLGACASVAAGVWVHLHPIEAAQPPCPITFQETGPATARGKNPVAHSGNGDTITINPETPRTNPDRKESR